MYGMVYLDASLTSSVLGAELSQLFCIKISHCRQRKNIINAVQLELNVFFFSSEVQLPSDLPLAIHYFRLSFFSCCYVTLGQLARKGKNYLEI